MPYGNETPQQIFGELLYEIYYRFLETEDEYFDYAPAPIPPQPQPPKPEETAMFWKVTDQPGWEGVAVVYWELAPGCLVNVSPSEAARYASRAGTTVEVWANSLQRLPWAEAQPLFFPRA